MAGFPEPPQQKHEVEGWDVVGLTVVMRALVIRKQLAARSFYADGDTLPFPGIQRARQSVHQVLFIQSETYGVESGSAG